MNADPEKPGTSDAPRPRTRGRPPQPNSHDRRTSKVSEYVTRQIIADIVDDQLQPGDHLPPAAAMTDRYDVGMASLREALRILEVSGLIQMKSGPGGGPVIVDRSGAAFERTIRLFFQIMGVTFRDVILARQQLEPLVAREAAERATPELRQRLLDHATTYDPAEVTFSEHAREFHDILTTQTPSTPILGLFARAVGDVYADFVRTRGPRHMPEDRAGIHEGHEAIARAILSGDGDAAERLMAEHLEGLGDYVAGEYGMSLDDLIEWD